MGGESSCVTAAALSAAASGVCVCPVCVRLCGVVMVLIGAAIKSVLKYLNKTRGECVYMCLSVCYIHVCVC